MQSSDEAGLGQTVVMVVEETMDKTDAALSVRHTVEWIHSGLLSICF